MKISRRSFLKASAVAGAVATAPGILSPRKAHAAYPQSPKLQKFVWPLRMPGLSGPPTMPNHYIPLALPNQTAMFDYYRIEAQEFWDQLHPSLGPTKLWGYVDVSTPAQAKKRGHLGGVIVARQGKPVRINYTNGLPFTHFLPVDVSLYGVSEGGGDMGRTAVHLHGGKVPWHSDGGPFHWFGSKGTNTYGLSNVPWLPNGAGTLTRDYWYPNEESERMMWYHDHAVGNTRLNAYAGLATAYIVRGPQEDAMYAQGLPLPMEQGGLEIPIVVQDKLFMANGRLNYPSQYQPNLWTYMPPAGAPPLPNPSVVTEMFGDTMLVNGTIYPYCEVEKNVYRFRILNACNSRFLNLWLAYASGAGFPNDTEVTVNASGVPTQIAAQWKVIGMEGGFLTKPVWPQSLSCAPAERFDVLVDFRRCPVGSRIILYNNAPAPFPTPNGRFDFWPGSALPGTVSTPGFGPNTRTLMQFRVVANKSPYAGWQAPNLVLPNPGLPLTPGVPGIPAGVPIRTLTLNEEFDAYGRLQPAIGTDVAQGQDPVTGNFVFGQPYKGAATETPAAGSTEVWQIVNLTADTHPMHIHLANAQIIERQAFDVAGFLKTAKITPMATAVPCKPYEYGWKETIQCPPGMVTRFIVTWALPKDPRFYVNGALKTTAPLQSPRTGGYEYVWHCHILEHEEHDMMRPLVVV